MCQVLDLPSAGAIVQRERTLLWTMRAWVMGIVQKIPVEEQIDDVFRRIGAPDATVQLYAFMWILNQGARWALDVDCVCSSRISADERMLLDILALAQQERTFEGMILLRSIVRRNAAVAAADTAVCVMRALSAAGFSLSPSALETGRYVFAG